MQRGINVYVIDTCVSSSVWQTDAGYEMHAIESLGANSVGIVFPFYTTGLNANSLFTSDQCPGSVDLDSKIVTQSPSPTQLGVLVQAAESDGLKVLLRPVLNETDLRPKWRGVIAPTNDAAWFSSYDTTLEPYLKMAQTDKVTRFDISVELNSLAKATQWASTISFAQKLYTGQLVFDADWVGASGAAGLVPHSHTSFAVDAYPKASKASPSSSVSQLLTQWNAAQATDKFPLPDSEIAMHEVGIPAENGAYANPSAFTGGAFNPTIQANWFTAACDFMKSHDFEGIYFWGPQFSYNSGMLMSKNDPTQPTELQPATQQAIKSCFK